jgi:hypothetical protein
VLRVSIASRARRRRYCNNWWCWDENFRSTWSQAVRSSPILLPQTAGPRIESDCTRGWDTAPAPTSLHALQETPLQRAALEVQTVASISSHDEPFSIRPWSNRTLPLCPVFGVPSRPGSVLHRRQRSYMSRARMRPQLAFAEHGSARRPSTN